MLLEHPELDQRDCNRCTLYQFDDKGKEVIRRGNPLRRPPQIGPPCRYGKCEKGTPDAQKSLTAANRAAYGHYLECKAVGSFPDDEIVRRNAGIIRQVEDAHSRGFAAKTMMAGMAATVSTIGK